MKKMKRIVAIIAMIAVLLSSMAFAQESAVEAVAADHLCIASCKNPGVCATCGGVPSVATVKHNVDGLPRVPVPGMKNVHGILCPDCGEYCFTAACYPSCKQPGVCAICGQDCPGAVEHNAGGEWFGTFINHPDDETKHCHLCVDCGEYYGIEEHTISCSATGLMKNTCTVCYARVEGMKVTHNYDEDEWFVLPTDDDLHAHRCKDCTEYFDYAEHEASCQNEKECKYCGIAMPDGKAEHTSADGVRYPITVMTGMHGYKCQDCGVWFNAQECYALCNKPGECAVCGQAIDSFPEHAHEGEANEYVPHPDDPTNKHCFICMYCGEYYEVGEHVVTCASQDPDHCDLCNGVVSDRFNVDHQSDNKWYITPMNPEYHARKCVECGDFFDEAPHRVECANPGVCADCGEKTDAEYSHNYGTEDKWYITPMNPEYHARKCVECGDFFDEAEHWVSCTNPGVCGDCGAAVSGDYAPDHDFTQEDWDNIVIIPDDYQYHGVVCTKCGEMVYTEGHEFVNGVCACGMKLAGMQDLKGPASLTVGVGEIINAGVEVIPAGSADVSYKSSSTRYATVDADGNIKGVRRGSAKIEVKAVDKAGKTLEGTIKLTVKDAPSKIVLEESEIDIGLGSTTRMEYEFNSSRAYSNVSWTSSNPAVATVDADGNVKGVGAGSATITATTFNGKKDSCVVNVKPGATIIILDDPEFSLNVKKTFKLTGKLTNEKGEECLGNLSFESSNPAIATVDSKGVVTGKAKSTEVVTITVRTDTGAVAEAKVRVLGEPSKFTLNVSSATLNFGDTLQIIPIIGEDEHATFTYKSSSTRVAKVDSDGVVTPVAEGKVTITVTSHNRKTAKATITVVDPYKPASVTIDQGSKAYVNIGETLQLSATMAPDTAESDLEWSSKSTKIAKVDDNGLVSGVKVGSTTITVETRNSKKDTITIEVVDPTKPYAVEIDKEGTIELNVGDTLQLNTTVYPDTAENKDVSWKSSKSSYAKVDANGLVTALKAYRSAITITATTDVNKETDTVKILVVDEHKPSSIAIQQGASAAMDVSETLQLGYALQPADAKSIVSWKSSSTSVATVDANGLVTPKKEGKVTITATTHNSKKASITITITDKFAPTSIAINEGESLVIGIGEELPLSYTLNPSDATDNVSWSTSNKRYVTVDENGVICGVRENKSATITVETHNGKTDSIKVSVKDLRPDDVAIAGNGTMTMAKGETVQLNATLLPAGSKSALTWTSSNDKIATVDALGNVSALAEGSVTITVTTANDKRDRITVYVEDSSKPTGVTLSHSGTVNVNLGETLQLSATLQPAGAISSLSWTSANKAIATVDAKGLVSGVAEGVTAITVVTENGKSASVNVKVVDPYKPTAVRFVQTGPVEIYENGKITLDVALEPVNAKTTLSWASGNPEVATVADGVVTGVKAGTTIITVTTENDLRSTIVVIVKIAEDGGMVDFTGKVGTLTDMAGIVGELESGWEWSDEADDYRVYYTVKGSDGALMINRRSISSPSIGEKIASVEIMKPCKYSIYGVEYGMTADEVIDILSEQGMKYSATDGNSLRCYPTSGFAILEIGFTADGTVNIVGGYSA